MRSVVESWTCDVCGTSIPEGAPRWETRANEVNGDTTRIADLCGDCAGKLGGREVGRRGRKPEDKPADDKAVKAA